MHLAPAAANDAFEDAIRDGQVWITPIVRLELLRGTLDGEDFERMERRLAPLVERREIPLTQGIANAAISAYRELAQRGSAGNHHVKVPDALNAAAAASRGYDVLHYNSHFDRLCPVFGIQSIPIARIGSLGPSQP